MVIDSENGSMTSHVLPHDHVQVNEYMPSKQSLTLEWIYILHFAGDSGLESTVDIS